MSVAVSLRRLGLLVVCCTLVFSLAGVASTTPTLPTNLHVFDTAGPSGFINPGVLVGFNPQPDPPGDNAAVDLVNPYAPTFDLPSSLFLLGDGSVTILFGIHGPGGDPVSFSLPGSDPMPNSDHRGTYQFDAFVGTQGFQVTLDLSGFAGGWQGFNPQPDPPGFGGQFVGFSFIGDPAMTVHLDALDANGNVVGPYAFTQAPEPASMLLVISGVVGLALRRKRR